MDVLKNFLQANPSARIGSIVAIDDPSPTLRYPGTRSLLVLHSDEGHWPEARTLELKQVVCTDYDPRWTSPRLCAREARKIAAAEPVLFMVGVSDLGSETTKPPNELGTLELLYLVPRTGSKSSAR